MGRAPAFALAAALAAAVLGLAACGGDDETTTAPTTTAAATGATGADETPGEGGSYDMTAGEFIAAPIADQIEAIQGYVTDNPDKCADVDPGAGGEFQVAVSIDAAQADPDTPFADVIAKACEKGGA